jgi:hypothetical protein
MKQKRFSIYNGYCQSDENQISHLLSSTDMSWRGKSEETSLRVTRECLYMVNIWLIIHWHTGVDWKWRQVEKTLQKRRFQFSPCTLWLQISRQQTIGTPFGTSCTPLLADLFLYSYESDFIHGLLKKNDKKLTWSFNFTFRYKDDDSEGRLRQKRWFQFICSNIPAATAYGVYIDKQRTTKHYTEN